MTGHDFLAAEELVKKTSRMTAQEALHRRDARLFGLWTSESMRKGWELESVARDARMAFHAAGLALEQREQRLSTRSSAQKIVNRWYRSLGISQKRKASRPCSARSTA